MVRTGFWLKLWLRLRFGIWWRACIGTALCQLKSSQRWLHKPVCFCVYVCERIKTFIYHWCSTLKITKECIVWEATSGIFCSFISVAASSLGMCGGVRRGLHAELVLERSKPSVTTPLHVVFPHLTGWLALFVTSSLWLHACFWCDTRLFSKLKDPLSC